MNNKKEGEYYSQMVRRYKDEYGGKNLQDFCIKEKVSFNKMLHCLRNDSYRKPYLARPVKPVKEQGLHPLVVDGMSQESQVSVLSFNQSKIQQPSVNISQVEISLSSKIHVNLHDCSVKTLISLIKEMEVSLC
jgi:hypothetical protein